MDPEMDYLCQSIGIHVRTQRVYHFPFIKIFSMKRHIKGVLYLMLSVWLPLHAQQLINTAGFSAMLGGKTYELSLGELAIHTLRRDAVQLTLGFLQPISGVTAVRPSRESMQWVIFPNPFFNELGIYRPFVDHREACVKIYNGNGQLMYVGAIKSDEEIHRIEDGTAGWPTGLYLVSIMRNGTPRNETQVFFQKTIKF